MTCPRCNGTATQIVKGKPPHFAQEVCSVCGRWIRWLPKAEALARGFGSSQVTEAHPGDERQEGSSTGETPL